MFQSIVDWLTESPHAKPMTATMTGAISGILLAVQAILGPKTIASVENIKILAGSGLTVGSIWLFVWHHRAVIQQDTANILKLFPGVSKDLQNMANSLDGMGQRVNELDDGFGTRIAAAFGALPVAQQVDLEALAKQAEQLVLSHITDAITKSTAPPVLAPDPVAPPAAA